MINLELKRIAAIRTSDRSMSLLYVSTGMDATDRDNAHRVAGVYFSGNADSVGKINPTAKTLYSILLWLPAILTWECSLHCLDYQVRSVQAQPLRVVAQIHNSDVYYLPFDWFGRKAKQGVTRIYHSPDVSSAKTVRRGYTMLHQIVSGCQPCLDRTSH